MGQALIPSKRYNIKDENILSEEEKNIAITSGMQILYDSI